MVFSKMSLEKADANFKTVMIVFQRPSCNLFVTYSYMFNLFNYVVESF